MTTRSLPKSTNMIYTIAIIGFIYSLHVVLPLYSSSSFLSLFADEQTLGLIYMTGAAVSILGFLIVPHVIRAFGNYRTVIGLIVIQIGLFWALVSSSSSLVVATAFILQIAVVALIGLSIDIFLEVYTNGRHVGAVRGLYTATLNASWLIAPLIGSMLINGSGNYRNTFVAALAMLFPLIYLIHRNFPKFHDPHYSHPSFWQLIKKISSNNNWIKLFAANIILQTFYAWMVVYSPIYLNKTVGFDWYQIGIIITIMLLPFPLIQYPLGKLSDSKYGEKEIMALGFGIMGVATIGLSFITSTSLIVWALALLCTRIGAASAEIMMETYFFKTVPTKDSSILGAFRITRPAAYFIAPAITTIGLIFTTNNNLFVIVGVITLIAVIPALMIKDTN